MFFAAMTAHVPVLAAVLADADDTAQQDQMRSVIDKAGPIAGLFVLLLGVALFFLFRSMSKQMKKIDPDLPPGPEDIRFEQDQEYTEKAVERGEEQQQG